VIIKTDIDIGDVVKITDLKGACYGEVVAIKVLKNAEVYYVVRFWSNEVAFKSADVTLFSKGVDS
jgi:hypothetical protein